MEFFDKLGKKASETYKEAAQRTSKLAKETKLKMLINDENLMIKIDEEKSSKLTLFKRARLVWKGTEKICEDELWVLAKWKLF